MILRGMGEQNLLITRGLGQYLAIVVVDTDYVDYPVGIYDPFDFRPEGLKTKTIKLPYRDSGVTVKVKLIKKEDLIRIKTILEKAQESFIDVEVFLEKEIEIYD